MEPIKVHTLSPDTSPIVGIAIVAHEKILASEPAVVSDLQDKLEVPLRFYRGNLNEIRTELHKLIDDAVDALQGA